MNLIDEADKFAEKYHDGQTRKDGSPYIGHPRRVRELYRLHNFPNINIQDVEITCLLHDLVEDNRVTLQMVQDRFGIYVAQLVNHLTRPKGTSKVDYYKLLGSVGVPCSKIVKLCDRNANLEDTMHLVTNYPSKENVEFARYYLRDTLNLFEYANLEPDKNGRITKDIFMLMECIARKVY